ncbi:MAG: aminoacetone oxidase family FAD-binding enzyme [Elusimicrobia bacterium]|nr:aminoacetone oxidase family FAD-binding enzyme [Elusimicrobiota bacterium]
MSDSYDVIVIGAGASGLAAAVEAARAGASVLVLEKNHVPGRKILSTGAGKCNFTNSVITPDRYHPPAAAFLKRTFAALPPQGVLSFFRELGLLWTEDSRGRLFPRSLKAQDVVSVLVNELGFRGGTLRTLTEAVAVAPGDGGFRVESCAVPPQWERRMTRGARTAFSAARVVLAAGGACYPQIGGTTAGYSLLRALGHSVSPLSPAIVPLRSDDPLLKELDGVRTEAALELKPRRGRGAKSAGELLFASYGLSGPAALDLSRAALAALKDGPVSLEADFFPEATSAALAASLQERARRFPGRPFRHFACGLLNEKLMKAAAARLRAEWGAPPGPGTPAALGALLKGFSFNITGTRGFDEAMVTAGGCPPAEVDPASFQSRKVPGLYVTGELLDIDGDSGGYNLHLAWTSGILAGRAASCR